MFGTQCWTAYHLCLTPGGVLHHGLGQGGAGGEAVEEGGDDVTAADGQHLLVGSHRVAVLLRKHLRQRHGEGKAARQKHKQQSDFAFHLNHCEHES